MRIKIDSLTKVFEDGRRVLENVNFSDEVQTLALIGPSGSGKSTLIRILGGLLQPTSGTVTLNESVLEQDERKLVEYRKKIGFVFQHGGLFHHLNALDNIALPLQKVHHYPKEEAVQRGMELLERFGLGQDYYKKPNELSGGQQQRVSIARAVAGRPELLLLDEPTSALDPEYTNEVLNIIHELKDEGMRFVIVTHEMGFAYHACDKVMFLYDGKIHEYGDSKETFVNPKTEELKRFLGKLLEWNKM